MEELSRLLLPRLKTLSSRARLDGRLISGTVGKRVDSSAAIGSSVRGILVKLVLGVVPREGDLLGLLGGAAELESVCFGFSFNVFRGGRGSSCNALLEAVNFVFENNSRATGKIGTNG